MAKTPYIGFGNNTLSKAPIVHIGDTITCPKCGDMHRLFGGINKDGEETDTIMAYRCGDKSYIAAVDGRFIIDIKPDVSGSL